MGPFAEMLVKRKKEKAAEDAKKKYEQELTFKKSEAKNPLVSITPEQRKLLIERLKKGKKVNSSAAE